MTLIARWEPSKADVTRLADEAMIYAQDLADGPEDLLAAEVLRLRHQLKGAVEDHRATLEAICRTGRWIDAKLVAAEALRKLGGSVPPSGGQ